MTEKTEITITEFKIPADSIHHDAWMYVSKDKHLFYLPYGHHYHLFSSLAQIGRGDLLELSASAKKNTNGLKFGDVKHGQPRTVKENAVTAEPLRTILVDCYNRARGKETDQTDE